MINIKAIAEMLKPGLFYEAHKNTEISLSKIPEKYQYLKDFICVAQINLKSWKDLRDGVENFRGSCQTPFGLYIQRLKLIGFTDYQAVSTTVGYSIKDSFANMGPEYEMYRSKDFEKVLNEMWTFGRTEIHEWILSSKILKGKNDD